MYIHGIQLEQVLGSNPGPRSSAALYLDGTLFGSQPLLALGMSSSPSIHQEDLEVLGVPVSQMGPMSKNGPEKVKASQRAFLRVPSPEEGRHPPENPPEE